MVRLPVQGRDFSSSKRPDRLWSPRSLLFNGHPVSFPGSRAKGVVKLPPTRSFQPVSRLRICEVIPPRQKDARGENSKINYGLDTAGEKENRTSKKNVDGRSTSSHDNKKFRARAMEKQRGMAFGFRKTATAVKKTGQIDTSTLPYVTALRSINPYPTNVENRVSS